MFYIDNLINLLGLVGPGDVCPLKLKSFQVSVTIMKGRSTHGCVDTYQ